MSNNILLSVAQRRNESHNYRAILCSCKIHSRLGGSPGRDSSGTQLRSCIPGTFVTASKPRCWMGIPTLHAASITIYYMVPLSPTESGRETGAEMEVLVSFLEHKFVFRVSIIY